MHLPCDYKWLWLNIFFETRLIPLYPSADVCHALSMALSGFSTLHILNGAQWRSQVTHSMALSGFSTLHTLNGAQWRSQVTHSMALSSLSTLHTLKGALRSLNAAHTQCKCIIWFGLGAIEPIMVQTGSHRTNYADAKSM